MLTRKHFQFFADLASNMATDARMEHEAARITPDNRDGRLQAVELMAKCMAVYFAGQNKAFDADRFMIAAGLKVRP